MFAGSGGKNKITFFIVGLKALAWSAGAYFNFTEMLAIKIEDEWIDLAHDAAMNITLKNPAFDPERIGRAYSYPVRLQHTQRNLYITRHRHRIDSRLPQQYLAAKAYIQDQLFEEGRLSFTEATNQSTEATFQNLDLSLAEVLGDMKLHDILAHISITQSNTSEYWLEPTGDRPYSCFINGDLYTGNDAMDNAAAMQDLVDQIEAVFPGIATYNLVEDRIEIAHNDPTIVFGASLIRLNVTYEYSLGDAAEANFLAYQLAASLDDSYPVAFPVVYAPNLYGNLNLDFEKYINNSVNDTPLLNSNAATENSWENTFIPFYRVRHILDTIAAQAGLSDIVFDIPAAQGADLNAMLVWNNYCLDQVYPNENFGAGTFKNGYTQLIAPANHVPDITALEFINLLAKSFNFHFRFRENRLFFTPNIRQIQNPPTDWTEYTQPYYERTFLTGAGVTLTFQADAEPMYLTQLEDYVLGDGYNSLEIPFRPVHHANSFNLREAINWKTAYNSLAGTSEPLDLATETDAFRLFFDRGQQAAPGGNTYWLGCFDNTDYAGTELGVLSLDFSGAAGLYTNFWKGWAEMLFRPTITRLVALPVGQLILMRAWNNTKVYIYDNQGEAICVVRAIQFKANAKGLGIAQVEMQML